MILLVSYPLIPFTCEISDNGNLGATICGCFVFFGALSVVLYKPWRRWIERCRTRALFDSEENTINAEDAGRLPSNCLGIIQHMEKRPRHR